jgi:hypothetical protein
MAMHMGSECASIVKPAAKSENANGVTNWLCLFMVCSPS